MPVLGSVFFFTLSVQYEIIVEEWWPESHGWKQSDRPSLRLAPWFGLVPPENFVILLDNLVQEKGETWSKEVAVSLCSSTCARSTENTLPQVPLRNTPGCRGRFWQNPSQTILHRLFCPLVSYETPMNLSNESWHATQQLWVSRTCSSEHCLHP